MAEMIRTFIALELNEATRRAIGDTQTKLKRDRTANSVRWVAPQSIHITLKFLGDVAATRMDELLDAVTQACAGVAPFALTIAGIGAFPNTRRPNVVWVGARGDIAIASQLAEQIENACEMLGYAREERPFAPHLTLGRVKRDASPSDRQALGKLIEQTPVGELGKLTIAHTSVMKSELRPGGSVYTCLREIRLGERGACCSKIE